jgi:hypothetical protein
MCGSGACCCLYFSETRISDLPTTRTQAEPKKTPNDDFDDTQRAIKALSSNTKRARKKIIHKLADTVAEQQQPHRAEKKRK